MPHSKAEALSKIEFGDCYFDDNCGCFFIDEPGSKKRIRCSGLLPVLKKIFYPDSEKGKYKKDTTLYKKQKSKQKKNKNKDRFDIGQMLGNKERGKLVHDQIRMINDPDTKKRFNEKYTKMDKFTVNAELWMKQNGWISIANELAICDKDTRIATAIDAVLYNPKTNELAIAEWKTGSLEFFYSYTRKMKFIVPSLNNSLYYQAQFQTVMTYYILVKNYLKNVSLRFDKLMILHLNDNGVRQHVIGQEMVAFAQTIYKRMCRERIQ